MQILQRYQQLPEILYHFQRPSPYPDTIAGHFNAKLADELQWTAKEKESWLDFVSGHKSFDNFQSLSMVYAGHQFGHWAGQLGDGRGILVAQLQNKKQQVIDLHLKGAGKTPYSRMGDGRAVLRSVIREYLAGHLLNSLNIPSSNAIGFVTTNQKIQREELERGAMLLRTSDCHIRLGHFEWLAQYQPELLADFTHKCMQWHYPECFQEEIPVLAFAQKVIENTANLIAQWQLIGFAHGVMNTDNFNITGSTLDFGPFIFMERFRPEAIFNHSDHYGRYVYQNQPSIARWNLWIWLNALSSLNPAGMSKTDFQQLLLTVLEKFEDTFLEKYQQGLAHKMGLPTFHRDSFNCGLRFLDILKQEQLDYSQSFILLQQKDFSTLQKQCKNESAFNQFLQQYQAIREYQDCESLDNLMQISNPHYILRTHSVQYAIDLAEQLDFSEVNRLFTLLSQPYTKQLSLEKPSDTQPAEDTNEVILSCSS